MKNCADPFDSPSIEEWSPNRMPYEKIVLSGKGYVSTEALSILSEHNRNVILLDAHGKLEMSINPVMDSFTATTHRMGQYDTFRDETKRKYLARQIIHSKIESQIRFLESTEKNLDIVKLKQHLSILTEDNVSKIEAVTSRIYWNQYSKLIDSRFEFHSRNAPLKVAKYGATDIINALLNYGYSILSSEICKFIQGVGLDPYYGFMHKNHTSFQSLVYDMMEPFRWLVECAVWRISDAKSKHRISKKQYAFTRAGQVILEYDLIRIFLEMLERTLQKERRYDYKFGLKTRDGLKLVQEITIAKIRIQKLAGFCIGK